MPRTDITVRCLTFLPDRNLKVPRVSVAIALMLLGQPSRDGVFLREQGDDRRRGVKQEASSLSLRKGSPRFSRTSALRAMQVTHPFILSSLFTRLKIIRHPAPRHGLERLAGRRRGTNRLRLPPMQGGILDAPRQNPLVVRPGPRPCPYAARARARRPLYGSVTLAEAAVACVAEPFRVADGQSRRADQRQSELVKGGPARPIAARGAWRPAALGRPRRGWNWGPLTISIRPATRPLRCDPRS